MAQGWSLRGAPGGAHGGGAVRSRLKPRVSRVVRCYMNGSSWPSHSLLVFAVALVASGCAQDEGESLHQRWDSAGIEIVESRLPLWEEDEGWTIEEEPLVDLGGPGGPPEAQFYIVTGTVVLPDGRIVVGHRGTNELVFFGPDGTFLEAHAGEGGGPGEFWGLYRLWLLQPDSLLVYDELERRVSIFDARGTFIRSWNPRHPDDEGVWISPISLAGDGSAIFGTRPEGWEIPRGASKDSLVFHRFDRDGNHLDSLGLFPWRESYRSTPRKTGTYSSRSWFSGLPFGRRSRISPFQGGFLVGRSEGYEIEIYSAQGNLLRLIRRPVPNRPVTTADISALKQDWLEDEVEEGMQSEFNRWVADMEFPETMPPYGRILGDQEGNLWVWDYSPPGNPVSRATVFDPEGRMLGAVDTPPVRAVFQIGAGFLLAFTRDEMDVEHVQVFRLHR